MGSLAEQPHEYARTKEYHFAVIPCGHILCCGKKTSVSLKVHKRE